MKSLTDFHYWFIYVFFNKGPLNKWTIKRKKETWTLFQLSTNLNVIYQKLLVFTIYTPTVYFVFCSLFQVLNVEAVLETIVMLEKRYSLSITSCIIRIFFKYIHKFIKKLRNSIRQFSIWLCWNGLN
jgi:hypothetical protein